jgi:hypothetical protein
MDMRFGTWSVTSLYRGGSLRTVATELAKCKLDVVAVQGLRRKVGGIQYGNENDNHHLGAGIFTQSYYPLRG